MARGNAKTKVSFCNSCRREYLLKDFYSTKNPFHKNGVTLYCKDCCEEIVQHYLKQTGTLETAMWFACSQIGVPFIRKAYDEFEKRIQTFKDKSGKEDSEYNLFANYYTCLTKNESKVDNWNDFSATDVALGDIQSLRKSEEALKLEMEKYKFDWGEQTIEDYQYLEYMFRRYAENIEFVNNQQEDLYRDLCLARLKKRHIEEGTDESGESIKSVQDRILTLMNKLKLDEFESNKPKSLSEQMIFAKIAQIEQTKPADLYKEPKKYKDFNKLRKYEKDMVLRPLLNTLAGHRDFNINIDDIERYNLDDD